MKLMLIASMVVLMAACSATSEQSTISDACQKDDGARLAVEGFLRPPDVMRTHVNAETELTTYQMVLVEGSDEKSPSMSASVFGTRTSRTNRIAELSPEGFTNSEVQIFTDTGEVAGSLDRLRITGRLSKDKKEQYGEPCVLKIERIEKP
jgi:hypothetical protein